MHGLQLLALLVPEEVDKAGTRLDQQVLRRAPTVDDHRVLELVDMHRAIHQRIRQVWLLLLRVLADLDVLRREPVFQ